MALGASGRDADCVSGCASDCPAGGAAGVLESYRQAFRGLVKKDLISFDSANACLVVPKFLKYNPPQSPSVVTAWNSSLDLIPECSLTDQLIENVIKYLQGYDNPSFLKAFNLRGGQTDRQTDRQQEQEQEQEQEKVKLNLSKDKRLGQPSSPGLRPGPSFSPQKLAELWNEKTPPELNRVNLPFKRKDSDMDKIKDALKRNPDPAWWESVILRLHQLPFVKGDNDRGWKISLDVMVRDAEKILDGKYAGGKSGEVAPRSRKPAKEPNPFCEACGGSGVVTGPSGSRACSCLK